MQKSSTADRADSKTTSMSTFDSDNELILGFCDEVEEMLSQFESNVKRLKEFVYDGSLIHEDYLSFLRDKDVREYLDAIEDYNRTVHTIKGTSLFMGFKKLNRYAHALEDVTTGIPSGDVILDNSVYRIINNSTSVFGRFVDKIREEISDTNFSIKEVVDEIDTFKVNSESPILSGIRLRDLQTKDLGRTRDQTKRKPKLSFDLDVFDSLLDDYMLSMNRVEKGIGKKDSEGTKIEYTVVVNDAKARPDIWEHVHTALIHMHRNAVDHGIETIRERKKFDKDPCASIKLAIWEDYKSIYITMSDDGRGIDPEKIAEAALEKNVISMDKMNIMSITDKIMLIFMAGFSTRTTVSDISGRGVGMDAVTHEIRTVLGGDVEVSSELGVGTKFTLHFPKSNSLTECLIVGDDTIQYGMHRHQEMYYVVMKKKDLRSLEGEKYYIFRNEIVPIVDLFSELGHPVSEAIYLVIIKTGKGRYVAISVPGIVGHIQLRIYRNNIVDAPYFFGQASYHGKPLVVLDIDKIIGIAKHSQDALPVSDTHLDEIQDAGGEESLVADQTKRWGIVVEGAYNLFIILNHNNIRFHFYDELLRYKTPYGTMAYTVDGSITPLIDLIEKFDMKCANDKKMIFTMSNERNRTNAYVVPNVIDQAELPIQGMNKNGTSKMMYTKYGSDIIEAIDLETITGG